MNTWKDRLAEKGVLISDGAWGTELARRGLTGDEVPELWNLDRPDDVRALAASYVAAGSDIILTNTFGGNRLKLAKAGLADRAHEINLAAATLSRQAAGNNAFVFASIGPSGEFLQPLGRLTETELIAAFAEQAAALAEGGADAVVIETFSDLNEVKAALRAVKDHTTLPAVVSLTYDKGPKGYATMMGVTPGRAAAELELAGADAVGANCGAGMENMIEIIAAIRPATSLPVWAKPNAGLPELVHGKTVFKQTPADMAAQFPALREAGANIIGGCCGTTPEHIRLFVAARDSAA